MSRLRAAGEVEVGEGGERASGRRRLGVVGGP